MKKIESLDNFELYKLALGSEDSEVDIFIADKGENDDTGSTSILQPRKSKITFLRQKKLKLESFQV